MRLLLNVLLTQCGRLMKNLKFACMMYALFLSLLSTKIFAREHESQPELTKLQQDVQSALVHDKLDAVAMDEGEPMIQKVATSELSEVKPLSQSAQKKPEKRS